MISTRPIVFGVIGVFMALLVMVAVPNLVETLDAKDILVVQSLTSGELTVYTDPTVKK